MFEEVGQCEELILFCVVWVVSCNREFEKTEETIK